MAKLRPYTICACLVLLSALLTLYTASCTMPAPADPASAAPASQFAQMPTAALAAGNSMSDTVATAISVTLPVTASANLDIVGSDAGGDLGGDIGSKEANLLLSNVDTALNQQYAEWLVTTGVTAAQLTAEMRTDSPSVTVTIILADEAAAPALQASLTALDATLLAQAGVMLAIQVPIGQLDQLAQLPNVTMIQMPTMAPPLSGAPSSVLARGGFEAPQQAAPSGAATSAAIANVDAWANSIPMDWVSLKALQAEKQSYFALADTGANEAYQEWLALLVAAGGDEAQAALASPRINVTLVMQDEASALAAREVFPTLNAQLLDSYAEWLVVSIPVGEIAPLMQLPGLLLAQQPAMAPALDAPLPRADADVAQAIPQSADASIVSAGVARSKINVWQKAGFQGKNVKVAIIDSFDQEILNDAFAHKEVPTNLINGPSTDEAYHGVAVAEIVHDMAPQATLSLNSIGSVPDYCIGFANTLVQLAKQGNNIISSSTGPTFCPSSADGANNPLAAAAHDVLYKYNTFYAQAAGNNAQHHYESVFKGIDDDGVVFHNFASGFEDTINVLMVDTEDGPKPANVKAGQQLAFYLRWDGGWPKSSQDYDLYLVFYNGKQWEFLTKTDCSLYPCLSQNIQNGSQLPLERIETYAPFTGAYGLVIVQARSDGDNFLDLLTSHAQPNLDYFSPSRSLVDASAYQFAFGVAAVDVTSLNLESYSSRGPTYGPGNVPGGGFAQPQLAAFANVDTYVAPGFNGTSSATPYVAGAAAVLKGAASCLASFQISDWLKRYAVDKGAPGYDFDYGAGVLSFPAVSKRPSCIFTNLYIPRVQR